MNRSRESKSDDVVFADVSMAILGPIAFLMLFFLIKAVQISGRPECDTPTEIQRQDLVRHLRDWHAGIEEEILQREHYLRQRCPDVPEPPAPDEAHGIVPEPLKNICPASRHKVLAAADLRQQDLDALADRRQAVASHLALCIGDTMNPQRPRCRRTIPAEEPELVPVLRDWADDLRQQVSRYKAQLTKQCGQTPMRRSPPDLVMLPRALASICQVDLSRLFAAAGVSQETLTKRLAMREGIMEQLSSCLGARNAGCQTLSDSERSTVVRDLRRWYAQREDEIGQGDERLQEWQCTQRQETAVPRDSLRPSPLLGLCPAEVPTVLRQAALSQDDIDRVAAVSRRVHTALGQCVPSREIARSREYKLNFRVCSTEFTDETGEVMDRQEVQGYFATLAKEVVHDLQNAAYNRIDVFGHSDARPIQNQCGRARDNEELSALRALAFRNELVNALTARSADLGTRLQQGSLRIYAIGVGDKEPIIATAHTEAEHKVNRRIELRYVTDQLRRPAP